MKKFKYNIISLSLLALSTQACANAQNTPNIAEVNATLETRSHFSNDIEFFTDVDDPAIWVHPTDKSRSVVITALKKGGLDTYSLDGSLIQHIVAAPAPACENNEKCENKGGRLNNVDLIYNFNLNGKLIDVAVASDRGLDTLVIYAIEENSDGKIVLKDITAANVPRIFTSTQEEVNEGLTAYGLATAKTDKYMAFVTQNSTTTVAQLELFVDAQSKVNYRTMVDIVFPNAFSLPNGQFWTPCSDDDGKLPHFEGMVADPENNTLFLAQEDVGIWKTSLSTPNDVRTWSLFSKVKKYGVPYSRVWDQAEEEYVCTLDFSKDPGYGDAYLNADAEGLTMYDSGNGKGYILASSQGDNTVALYQREGDNQYISSFTVTDGSSVDAVNETDGMMVVNVNLGGKFDQGLLVMQDGKNATSREHLDGAKGDNSNFKYVAWRDIASKLNLPVNTKDLTRK